MSIAFLFPGQGAQYAGMGRELYAQYAVVRAVFEEASDACGQNVWALCLDEDGTKLATTAGVQPAMVALECALTALLREHGIVPAAAAGLSLGEYAALACGGMLPAGQAVMLVAERGRLMEQAARATAGSMAAVLSLSADDVQQACAQAGDGAGQAYPCNYNCPGQLVIGGEKAAVERAGKICLERGARRVLPLDVAGAFHTPYMQSAADRYQPLLGKTIFTRAMMPVYSNVTAMPHGEDAAQALYRQITSPVRWEDTLRNLVESGTTTFIEVGPGRTLSGFVRKTLPGATVYNVENAASLEATLKGLST